MYIMLYLFYLDCVDKIFGTGTYLKNLKEISRKSNQKCIDICNKLKKTYGNAEKKRCIMWFDEHCSVKLFYCIILYFIVPNKILPDLSKNLA